MAAEGPDFCDVVSPARHISAYISSFLLNHLYQYARKPLFSRLFGCTSEGRWKRMCLSVGILTWTSSATEQRLCRRCYFSNVGSFA